MRGWEEGGDWPGREKRVLEEGEGRKIEKRREVKEENFDCVTPREGRREKRGR